MLRRLGERPRVAVAQVALALALLALAGLAGAMLAGGDEAPPETLQRPPAGPEAQQRAARSGARLQRTEKLLVAERRRSAGRLRRARALRRELSRARRSRTRARGR